MPPLLPRAHAARFSGVGLVAPSRAQQCARPPNAGHTAVCPRAGDARARAQLSGSSFCVSGLRRGVRDFIFGARRPLLLAKSRGDELVLYECVSGLKKPGSASRVRLPLYASG